jgi:hypothetical protein
MRQLQAEQSLVNPKIDGKRWQLHSTQATKSEANIRAKTVRKVYGKARIRKLSEPAKEIAGRTKLGKWGVYHP